MSINFSATKKTTLVLLRNVKRSFTYGWGFDKKSIIAYGLSACVQVATSIFGAYFAGRLINEIVRYLSSNDNSRIQILQTLALSVGSFTVEQLAWRYMSYVQNSSYLRWNTTLAPDFNGKMANLDIQRFENSEFNKLINKVTQDYNWKPSNFMYYCFNAMHAMLGALSTAIVLVSFAPWLIVVLLLAVIPSLLVEQLQSKVKWDIWHIKSDASRRYHKITWMMQNKTDVMDIRLFGLNSYLIDYCRKMLHEFNREQQTTLKRFIKPAMAIRLLEGIILAGIELWLIFKVLARGAFSIGQYSFYSGIVRQFNNSVGLVLSSLGQVLEYNLYMTDFFKFMDTPAIVKPADNPFKIEKNIVPEITFENVSFAYPGTKRAVFKNLNFTIKQGEHIALVGENGVGKSTLIKLLLRFYDVDAGRILINGQDIRDLDINTWYRHISVLFQDFSKYPFTISENIWIGRIGKDKDMKRVVETAKLAGLEQIVNDLPKGYDSILDNSFDEGIEPSGGQWQRVALARAFYRNASVLILDEPTAAIDAKAEYEIFNNIFGSHTGKTAIIISHRFSTVRKADRIVVLEKGTIVEEGNHESLLKNKGLYHEMFNKQAEGYR